MLTIWQKELKTYFLSLIAYVTTFSYLAITAWVFLDAVRSNIGGETELPVLMVMSILLALPFLAAVITMRLFAEERRSGTIEMLMTSPVTELEVVLGKYAGALTFMILVILPAISFIFILSWLSPGIQDVDIGAVIGGTLILSLICAFVVATGLIASLMTRNQIIAAITCLLFIFVSFLLIQGIVFLPGKWRSEFSYVLPENHILSFARGVIDTRPIVLYISFTALLVFAAVRLLQLRRWR